ncbi:MAG: hypothetical protein L3J69_02505 [Desulfobacula sp.]|nr:hypothetical protein [Desulfobacula sp.]
MKFFPLKIAITCLLLTPILYVLTLSICENQFDKRYSDQIQNILIGDTKPLLDGSVHLEEQIAMNIDRFLRNDFKVEKAGLAIKVRVITQSGKIIYPIFLDVDSLEKNLDHGFDSDIIGKKNFDILNNGLEIKIETNLNHGSLISNAILIFYCGISFGIFFIFYSIGSSKAEKETEKKTQIITDLMKEEESYKQILKDLKKDRQGLFENIKILNSKYQNDITKAKVNEDELFEEIISLEAQLKSFIDLKRSRETEISELKSKVQKFERRKSPKHKRHEFEFYEKRFTALYRSIKMDRKALSGFLKLNEDQQIKAEELIHLLDRNIDKIVIKRKVFSGKKHRTACFEVLFAYNGRLYFRKNKNNKTDVLVIGTKNTQSKDMEFLHHL